MIRVNGQPLSGSHGLHPDFRIGGRHHPGTHSSHYERKPEALEQARAPAAGGPSPWCLSIIEAELGRSPGDAVAAATPPSSDGA